MAGGEGKGRAKIGRTDFSGDESARRDSWREFRGPEREERGTGISFQWAVSMVIAAQRWSEGNVSSRIRFDARMHRMPVP